jgi:hypothetical protein
MEQYHTHYRANLATAFPEYCQNSYAYKKKQCEDFFRQGVQHVNAAGGSDDGKVSYNFNFGHLNDEGFTWKQIKQNLFQCRWTS